MDDDILERNKNLNRGFRKLRVWREAIELYAFEKKVLGEVKALPFKIRDQVLDSAFSISSNYPKDIVGNRLRSIFSLLMWHWGRLRRIIHRCLPY